VPPPADAHLLQYAPPPARPWRWLNFVGGFATGVLGCVVAGLVVGAVATWAGVRSAPLFFAVLVPLLAALVWWNFALERRRFASRGFALGVAISVGLNGLLCGVCSGIT
jgi:hypothetical protein